VPESVSATSIVSSLAAFLAAYSDTATISDSTASRLLWELINDYQAGSWGTIATGTNSTWTVINTSTNVSWIEIKTLQ
jgi:hypothetical protein